MFIACLQFIDLWLRLDTQQPFCEHAGESGSECESGLPGASQGCSQEPGPADGMEVLPGGKEGCQAIRGHRHCARAQDKGCVCLEHEG